MTVITDWGAAILTSLGAALALVFSFVPKLVGFLVILLIGWIVATAISKALTFLLRKVGFDRLAQRIGLTRFEQSMGIHMDAADLLGRVTYWFVFLIFLVPAVNALGLTAVSNILNQIVAYIPNVFVAILVLFLGGLAATFVADIVRGATSSAHIGNPNVFANIARYAILGFAALIALEQLQIAPSLINILFMAIVGAAALAFGLAFGLGGRDTAQRLLSRSESSLSSAAAQMNTEQAQRAAQQNMAQQNMAQQNMAQAHAMSGMPQDQYRNMPPPPDQYRNAPPPDQYRNAPPPDQYRSNVPPTPDQYSNPPTTGQYNQYNNAATDQYRNQQ